MGDEPLTNVITNRRYVLQSELGRGGMGVVYRAKDRLTGEVIAYKQILSQDHTATTNFAQTYETDARLSLANEFEVLASLRHPYVIGVQDYGFTYNRQPFFTMTLLQGPQTIIEAGRDASLAKQVQLLMQLLQALAYIHRRGILHRDLKPDNVLIANDRVHVMDFGLAVLQDQYEPEDALTGTMAYMAPELLQGGSPSVASDLYAVGMMAYEIFTGEYPFQTTDVGSLMMAIISQEPDLGILRTAPISPSAAETMNTVLETSEMNAASADSNLTPFLRRLLDKDPDQRYANAQEAMQALADCSLQPMPVETLEIRESYLQAAPLTGREAELEQLIVAMRQAVNGTGSGWLIAGESGIGKSRLLEELRTRALIQGALVLRGQATAYSQTPYAVWRGVLERLVLYLDITSLEASILKPIVPNIDALLGYDVPVADPLEPQQAHERLASTILALFKRCLQPVVVLLDDLHHASMGLDIIKRLNTIAPNLSLLVVGSYRNDERPDMADELPDLHQMTLQRLQPDDVAELAASMIGERGRNPKVVALLQREAEGNVFFLVEVTRALAESFGNLADIGSATLPQSIFTGGIQAVIERRLSHVPAQARPMLVAAALMNRQLDLRVLQALHAAYPDLLPMSLDDWLTVCANIAIFDKQDERWRFAHDKIRDQLTESLTDNNRQTLHHRVAQAIESTYPNDDSQALALAYHWRYAGDAQAEKPYVMKAGQQMYATSNFDRAAEYFSRAHDISQTDAERGLLRYWLGEVARNQSRYDEAIAHYEQAQALSTDDKYLAQLGLGRVLLAQGDYDEALEQLNQSLQICRERNDKRNESVALYVISRVKIYQGALDESNAYAQQALEAAHDVLDRRGEAIALYAIGSNLLQMNEPAKAQTYLRQALTIEEELGNKRAVAFNLLHLAIAHFQRGQYRIGLQEAQKALIAAQDMGDRRLVGSVLLNTAHAYENIGDYAAAIDNGLQAVAINRAIGSKRLEVFALLNLTSAYLATGNYVQATQSANEAIETAQELGDTFNEAWVLVDRGRAALRTGLATEGVQDISRAVQIAQDEGDDELFRRCYVAQSRAYASNEQIKDALAAVDNALQYDAPEHVADAPVLKAMLLTRLDRKPEAIAACDDAQAVIDAEMAKSQEKYEPYFAQAHIEAVRMLTATPADQMTHMMNAMEAYQQAGEMCAATGVIDDAIGLLQTLMAVDPFGYVMQVMMTLYGFRSGDETDDDDLD